MCFNWSIIPELRIDYLPEHPSGRVYFRFVDLVGNTWVLTDHATYGLGFVKTTIRDIRESQLFTSPYRAKKRLKDFAKTKSYYLYELVDMHGTFYNLTKQPSKDNGECLFKPKDGVLMTKEDFDEVLNA